PGVGVAVGVKPGSGVGATVIAGVGGAVGVGATVSSGVGAGVGVGVKVGSGVGVGVGTGLTDWPQLSVRKHIRRRDTARKQELRFRSIVKNPFKTRFKLL